MYTTYILHSATLDKFYIGFTGDEIQLRIAKHLSNHNGFTAKAKDWRLVYKEIFPSKHDAMARESQLKNWKNKKRIQELIAKGSSPDCSVE